MSPHRFAAVGIVLALALNACALFTSKNAKTLGDTLDVACIIANAFLDDAALQTACKIQDELLPKARDIASATREKVATEQRSAAARCSDAGP